MSKPPPNDPTKYEHNMTTRAKKNYHNSQEGSIQSTSAEPTPRDDNNTQNTTNTVSQPTQSASADETGSDKDNDPPSSQDKTKKDKTKPQGRRPAGFLYGLLEPPIHNGRDTNIGGAGAIFAKNIPEKDIRAALVFSEIIVILNSRLSDNARYPNTCINF